VERAKAILVMDDPVTSFDNERIDLILIKLDELQRSIKESSPISCIGVFREFIIELSCISTSAVICSLESQGGECVFSSEWDKHAQDTYEANFGDKPDGDCCLNH
jgi:hypothetical protein